MDDELGTKGAEDTGASGTDTAQLDESQRSLNSQAKDLPWVKDMGQELKATKAELDAIKQAQADEQASAERLKLEQKGDYEAVLEAERKKYKELEEKNAELYADTKMLNLQTEMLHQGVTDKRVAKLFINDWDQASKSVEDYVSSVKKSEENAKFFTVIDTEQSIGTLPAAGRGRHDDFDPGKVNEWAKSKDPKKRERAFSYLDKQAESEWTKEH